MGSLTASLGIHTVLFALVVAGQSPPRLPAIGISLYAGDRDALGPSRGGEGEGRADARRQSAGTDATSTAPVTEASTTSNRGSDTVAAAARRRRASLRSGARPTDNAVAKGARRNADDHQVTAAAIRTPRQEEARGAVGPLAGSVGQFVADDRASGGSGTGQASTPGAGGGVVGLAATCLACPRPTYPRQARRRGWQGVVDLRLFLDAMGRVADVGVAQSSGFKVLDDAAVAAARRSRFHRRLDGGRVESWGRMRYRFEIDDG